MAALKGHRESALKVSECFMDGKGVPEDPEAALIILILLADDGMDAAKKALDSMSDFDLAECDGDLLRGWGFREWSRGRRVLERIDAVE